MGDAAVWTREQVTAGVRDAFDFTISPADMDAFTALSGDENPLHTDTAFAIAQGYTGRVVYGALLIAKLSQLIGMRLPGRDSLWASVTLRFHAPLYVGETATAEGEVTAVSASTGLVVMTVTIRVGDRMLAKGKAEVVLAAR